MSEINKVVEEINRVENKVVEDLVKNYLELTGENIRDLCIVRKMNSDGVVIFIDNVNKHVKAGDEVLNERLKDDFFRNGNFSNE